MDEGPIGVFGLDFVPEILLLHDSVFEVVLGELERCFAVVMERFAQLLFLQLVQTEAHDVGVVSLGDATWPVEFFV